MNSQQFLILNAVILLVLIIWFLTGRRAGSVKPTQLKMKKGNAPAGTHTIPSGRYSDPKYQKYLIDDSIKAPSKELNVLFNYNGHTWDAYEVLGVPAGENIVAVTRAYQDLIKKSSPESQEFLETAFKAILAKK